MNKFLRIPVYTAGTGAVLFAASLVIYYWNLDMKLMAAVQPLLAGWYDHIERRPMLPPDMP